MGRGTVGLVGLVAWLAVAPAAHAAKTVGSNLDHPADSTVCPIVIALPPDVHACTDAIAGLNPFDAAPYGPTIPSSGVITGWRIKRGDDPFEVKAALRVIRDGMTGVGTSDEETLPGSAGVYGYPTRLVVQPGDEIGVDLREVPFYSAVTVAHSPSDPSDLMDEWVPQLEAGGSTPPSRDNADGIELLLQVDLEPDADGDGYGDETQDACPALAVTQGPCDAGAPNTTITKPPKRKTTGTKASVAFRSSMGGSSFDCSLDGTAYGACRSPWKLKRLSVGDHYVLVRATAGGIPDPSPAKAAFSVKKKKRR